MKKTNAARILDQQKIPYHLLEYEVDENDLGAETVAYKIGKPIEMVYKTIVLRGDKTGVIAAIIPGAAEVDLKALAAVSGNKKCMPIPLKEVQPLTGYIRGGVSPVGMKKDYPIFMDASALQHENICVSAGMRGLQFCLSAADLQKSTQAITGTISV